MDQNGIPDSKLLEILDLCVKLPEGPWELDLENNDSAVYSKDGPAVCYINEHKNERTIMRTGQTFNHDTARFIQECRTLVPELIKKYISVKASYEDCLSVMQETQNYD